MTISSALLLLLVVALVLSGPLIAGGLVLWRKRRTRSRKRSPLTADLLRGPGYSLRAQIDTLRDKVDEYLILLLFLPIGIYSVHVSQSYFFSVQESTFRTVIGIVGGTFAILWASARLLTFARRLDHMRVALDAEMAVGQELDQLMRNGAVVFHDVPAEKFNIDHLVVARSGLFAVETKGRTKPIRGRGAEDATVVFDGRALHFPCWSEVSPLSQADRQAKWIAEWLTSAVGAPVESMPVLAIPGWFVDRRGPGTVLVYNGKNPQFLLKMKRGRAHRRDDQEDCSSDRAAMSHGQAGLIQTRS